VNSTQKREISTHEGDIDFNKTGWRADDFGIGAPEQVRIR